MKPRNKTAISALLKKSHAHKSKKDYDRKREKRALKKEIETISVDRKGTVKTKI